MEEDLDYKFMKQYITPIKNTKKKKPIWKWRRKDYRCKLIGHLLEPEPCIVVETYLKEKVKPKQSINIHIKNDVTERNQKIERAKYLDEL